jgi:hypothetical protein
MTAMGDEWNAAVLESTDVSRTSPPAPLVRATAAIIKSSDAVEELVRLQITKVSA